MANFLFLKFRRPKINQGSEGLNYLIKLVMIDDKKEKIMSWWLLIIIVFFRFYSSLTKNLSNDIPLKNKLAFWRFMMQPWKRSLWLLTKIIEVFIWHFLLFSLYIFNNIFRQLKIMNFKETRNFIIRMALQGTALFFVYQCFRGYKK